MELTAIPRLTALLVMFAIGIPAAAQSGTANNLEMRFEILSVRKMGPDEAARRLGDNIGLNLCVKFRLTNVGRTSLHFFAWKDNVVPFGNTVRKVESGVVWVSGKGESKLSPGIEPAVSGAWIALAEGSAIEWEAFDREGVAEKFHAATIFLKSAREGDVIEVFSDFYKVPAKTLR